MKKRCQISEAPVVNRTENAVAEGIRPMTVMPSARVFGITAVGRISPTQPRCQNRPASNVDPTMPSPSNPNNRGRLLVDDDTGFGIEAVGELRGSACPSTLGFGFGRPIRLADRRTTILTAELSEDAIARRQVIESERK